MKRTMLLPHLIEVRYIGTGAVATVVFANTGGTSAGLLTLTDDDGANAFDLGVAATDTVSELVAAVDALGDWEARACMGVNFSQSLTTANLAVRAVASLASTNAINGFWIKAIDFTNDYLTAALSATTTPVGNAAVDVRGIDKCAIQFEITGADAGATGNVTFLLQGNNPERKVTDDWTPHLTSDIKSHQDSIDEDEWDTLGIDGDTMAVALNGASEVRKSFSLDLTGIGFVRLGPIVNADDGVVLVKAYLLAFIGNEMK